MIDFKQGVQGYLTLVHIIVGTVAVFFWGKETIRSKQTTSHDAQDLQVAVNGLHHHHEAAS